MHLIGRKAYATLFAASVLGAASAFALPTTTPTPTATPTPKYDLGDAADPPYPSLLTSNGARHVVNGVRFGASVDAEFDAQTDNAASADDADEVGAVGIAFTTTLVANNQASIQIESPNVGTKFVSGWIDFTSDGDWSDPGDTIFFDHQVTQGTNAFLFPVSPIATAGLKTGRVRISSSPGLTYTGVGPAPNFLDIDGEVEDFQVQVVVPTPSPTVSPTPSLIINELLADPPGNPPLAGDANGDLVVNATQDEFIEIVNGDPDPVDLSGFMISDGVQVRHVFPSGSILQGNCSMVVFGGGTPTGAFGYAFVQVASTGRLDLNNTSEVVSILDALGSTTIATYTYATEANMDQSITRSPDVIGAAPLVLHTNATGSGGRRFSPGTLVDGTSFSGCTGPTPTPTPSPTPTVSLTPTESISPTLSPTETPSLTPSISPTPTASLTPSISPTPSLTPSISPTPTETPGPPVIISQPSSQVANAGQEIHFNVGVLSGGPTTYQWLKDGQPLSDTPATQGTQTARLVFAGVSNLDIATYTVDVTNVAATVTSDPATLVVYNPHRANDGEYVSTTLPTTMFAGESINAGFVFVNTSDLTWSKSQNYNVGIIGDPGNLFLGNTRMSFPDDVVVVPAHGGTQQFVALVTAPAAPGTYTIEFRLLEEGIEFFGTSKQLQVQVIPRPNAATDWSVYE